MQTRHTTRPWTTQLNELIDEEKTKVKRLKKREIDEKKPKRYGAQKKIYIERRVDPDPYRFKHQTKKSKNYGANRNIWREDNKTFQT